MPLIKKRYKDIVADFIRHKVGRDYWILFVCSHSERPFPFTVQNGRIQIDSSPFLEALSSLEMVDVIPKSEWKEFGLDIDMVNTFLFDGAI